MQQHRIWAEIDLDAVQHNYRQIRSQLASDTGVMAVLKANGYGHGALPVARALVPLGLSAIGVGNIEEAVALRNGGIGLPILVLGAIIDEEMDAAVEYDVAVNVMSIVQAERLATVARRAGKTASVQLLIDTGMGRLGVQPRDARRLLMRIRELDKLKLDGMYTHFSSPDEVAPDFTLWQLRRFRKVMDMARELGLGHIPCHAAGHAALLRYPQAHFDLVRPGMALYGITPGIERFHKLDLRRVLALRTRVVFVKDVPANTPIGYSRAWVTPRATRVATLSIGYHDGFPVGLANRASVLLRGLRCPLLGRPTMDYAMVDASALSDLAIGEVATVIGRDGADEIRVEDVAALAQTIPYEITCGIGRRVRRIYHSAAMTMGNSRRFRAA